MTVNHHADEPALFPQCVETSTASSSTWWSCLKWEVLLPTRVTSFWGTTWTGATSVSRLECSHDLLLCSLTRRCCKLTVLYCACPKLTSEINVHYTVYCASVYYTLSSSKVYFTIEVCTYRAALFNRYLSIEISTRRVYSVNTKVRRPLIIKFTIHSLFHIYRHLSVRINFRIAVKVRNHYCVPYTAAEILMKNCDISMKTKNSERNCPFTVWEREEMQTLKALQC